MLKNKILLSTFVFSLACAQAQLTLNSPYSRLGIGKENQTVSNYYAAMSGLGNSFANPNAVNMQNPALLSSINTASFDVGFGYKFLHVSEQNLKNQSNSIALKNIDLAFPIKNKYFFAFGLRPYTTLDYNIEFVNALDSISESKDIYLGNGGISKASFSNSLVIWNDTINENKLSLGLAGNVFFGNDNRSAESRFFQNNKESNSYTSSTFNSVYRGYGLQLGLSYRKELFAADGFETIKDKKCNQQGNILIRSKFFFQNETTATSKKLLQSKYAIIVVGGNDVKVSSDIKNGEKRELLTGQYQSFVKKGFGVLVLSDAENVGSTELKLDYQQVVNDYIVQNSFSNISNSEKYAKEYIKKGSGIFLNTGISYDYNTSLQTDYTQLLSKFGTLSQKSIDTFLISTSSVNSNAIPGKLRFGISIDKPYPTGFNNCGEKRKSTWMIGTDISYANASEIANVISKTPQLQNNQFRWVLGGQITPNPALERMNFNNGFRRLLNQISYIGGIYFEKTPYLYNSKDLIELGMDFGFNVPTNRDGGFVTWSFGVSQLGTELKETYIKTGLGLSINEGNWFKPYRLGR